MTSKLSLPRRSPKLDQNLKLSISTAKEMVTGSGNCPRYLADKRDGKVNKGILDIHVIDVYFTSVYSNPRYLIMVQLLRVVTRNKSCKINKD